MELPANSREGPPLWIVNGSLAVKTKLAGAPPAPRLPMAITGSVTAEENVMVFTPVPVPPVSVMLSRLGAGPFEMLPPENVDAGNQLVFPPRPLTTELLPT